MHSPHTLTITQGFSHNLGHSFAPFDISKPTSWRHPKASMTKFKKNGETGRPCRTPTVVSNKLDRPPHKLIPPQVGNCDARNRFANSSTQRFRWRALDSTVQLTKSRSALKQGTIKIIGGAVCGAFQGPCEKWKSGWWNFNLGELCLVNRCLVVQNYRV